MILHIGVMQGNVLLPFLSICKSYIPRNIEQCDVLLNFLMFCPKGSEDGSTQYTKREVSSDGPYCFHGKEVKMSRYFILERK